MNGKNEHNTTRCSSALLPPLPDHSKDESSEDGRGKKMLSDAPARARRNLEQLQLAMQFLT